MQEVCVEEKTKDHDGGHSAGGESEVRKELGKIKFVRLGFGGYQEAAFGLVLEFEMKGSGVGTFISGGWNFKPSEHAKWTEDDRRKSQSDLCMEIIDILKKAKVDDVAKLKGIPVELSFDGLMLKSWRVLEEVL